ncbi:19810_t:CDS:2, partial [Racocetra persica]
ANIATAINDVLVEFNLVNKTLALTTNNESAMLVCRSTYHRLEIVDQNIVNIRTLMSKIKESIVLCDELKELYNVQKLDYLKPELNIVTKILAVNHDEIQNLIPTPDTWTKIK